MVRPSLCPRGRQRPLVETLERPRLVSMEVPRRLPDVRPRRRVPICRKDNGLCARRQRLPLVEVDHRWRRHLERLEQIGGQLLAGTGPTAYTWGNDRIGWLVTGTNNALYHMWDDATGRHGWEKLGGYLTSSPAAAAPTSGVIDVFVRGGSGALWQMEYNNGWQSWGSHGGVIYPGTGPAACSWGSGRLDVFVEGMSGALYHQSYASATWSSWENLGGYLTSSPAAATAPGSSRIDIFVRGGDSGLWWKTYNG